MQGIVSNSLSTLNNHTQKHNQQIGLLTTELERRPTASHNLVEEDKHKGEEEAAILSLMIYPLV